MDFAASNTERLQDARWLQSRIDGKRSDFAEEGRGLIRETEGKLQKVDGVSLGVADERYSRVATAAGVGESNRAGVDEDDAV